MSELGIVHNAITTGLLGADLVVQIVLSASPSGLFDL
jgi:hypothetical protein